MSNNTNFNVSADLLAWAKAHDMDEQRISAFVSANATTVSLVYETWRKMLDTVPELAPVIELSREPDGRYNFFTLYTVCKDLAELLIKHVSEHGSLPAPYDTVPPRRLLTVLRYPKRMPLLQADWLEQEAKEKFFSMMGHCSNYDDNPDALLPQYSRRYGIIHMYKEVIHGWLDEILPPVIWFNEDPDPFVFSPGAVADACTNPFCKWFRAEHTMRSRSTLLPIPVVDPIAHRNPVEEEVRTYNPTSEVVLVAQRGVQPYNDGTAPTYRRLVSWTTRYWRRDEGRVLANVYYVKPITVPKQINSMRVVCPERAYNARLQSHISRQLRKWWKNAGLDCVFAHDDQTINRRRAWKGSIWENIATIDCTAASDTVFRDLIYAIDHPTLNYLLTFMPQAVVWGSKTVFMGMFGTMGSPLTFDVEEIIFYIMGRLGMVMHDFGRDDDTATMSPKKCGLTIVGDDLETVTLYAEEVLQAMELCHMVPNEDKTFVYGHYKESCGGEYMDGIDVSGVYWPRGLSVDDVENTRWDGWKECYTSPTISLVSHHNSLLTEGYKDAADAIMNYIRGSIDLGFGLDCTGEWPDTLKGISLYKYEDPDGNVRFSSYFHVDKQEYTMLYSPTTTWMPAEPKKACWCNGVPDSVLEMLLDEWRYYTHDVYISDHGAYYSLPRKPYVRMKPRTKLDLNRHS